MGKKGMQKADKFSQRVAEEVQKAITNAGLSNAKVIRDAHMSQDYFYRRMRGEKPFTTNDISKIAEAIGVEPFALMLKAAGNNIDDLGIAADHDENKEAESHYDPDAGA